MSAALLACVRRADTGKENVPMSRAQLACGQMEKLEEIYRATWTFPLPLFVHSYEKLGSGIRCPHHFPDVCRFSKSDCSGVLELLEGLNNVYQIPETVPGTF